MNTPVKTKFGPIEAATVVVFLLVAMITVSWAFKIEGQYLLETLGVAGFLLSVWNLTDKKVPIILILAALMAYTPYAQADNHPRPNPNPPPQYSLVADGPVPVSVMMFVKSEIDRGTLRPFYPDCLTGCMIIVSMVIVAGVVVYTVHYICDRSLRRRTNNVEE